MNVEVWTVQELALPLISFICFLFTIYTMIKAMQFRESVVNAENQVMGLLDEALQVMIPAGICKHICNPNLNMTIDRADSRAHIGIKPGHSLQEIEYPEEVSVALRNEDEIYDHFGERLDNRNIQLKTRRAIELAVKGTKKHNDNTHRRKPSTLHSTTKSEEIPKMNCKNCRRLKMRSLPTANTIPTARTIPTTKTMPTARTIPTAGMSCKATQDSKTVKKRRKRRSKNFISTEKTCDDVD